MAKSPDSSNNSPAADAPKRGLFSRKQDAVFRAIGRPGVVLVSEGPSHRVRPLLDGERKKLARILPNVTIHVIESGRGEGQTPISQVAKKMNKLDKELTK